MRDSSSSATGLLLPFGSLMGAIPIDSVSRRRVLGDFSSVIGCDRFVEAAHAIPWSVEPVPVVPRSRRP